MNEAYSVDTDNDDENEFEMSSTIQKMMKTTSMRLQAQLRITQPLGEQQ